MTFILILHGLYPGDVSRDWRYGLQTCLTVARQINEQTSNRAHCVPARK